MNLLRSFCLLCLLTPFACSAQNAPMNAPDPAFEVATIKPSAVDERRHGPAVSGHTFHAYGMTVSDLLAMGFEIHVSQVLVRGGWPTTEKFDVSGTPDADGQPNESQWNGMLKKLMVERLSLRFHHDMRHLPAYSLTAVESGEKLTPTRDVSAPYPAMYFTRPGRLVVQRGSMADVCQLLQNAVFERPVVNATGLSGKFDFTLNWAPDDTQFHGTAKADTDTPLPSLYEALKQQLGLQLKFGKPEVPVIVVDQISRPAAN